MGLRHNALLSLGLVVFAASIARADVLELSDVGAQKVAEIEQANAGKYGGKTIIQQHLDPQGGSRFGFVRGMIVVEHGAAGDLNFTGPGADDLNQHPELYFKFRPYNWVTRNGSNINWTDFRFEWKWVSSVKQEIDTLDDLCAMVSWRCQAPANGDPVATMQNGLRWFVQQLDPKNQFDVGGGGSQATNGAHEGSITRYLLYGEMSRGERLARVRDCRTSKGPIGEYGNFDESAQKGKWQQKGVKYTPMDPDWWDDSPESAVARLILAMARCQKADPNNKNQTLYNIPYSDQIQASARLLAQFLAADLAGVPVSNASADPKADRIRAFSFRARAALLGFVEGVTPERIVARRARPVCHGGKPAQGAVLARPNEADIDAQLRYSHVDDDLPVTVFDMASAALDVILFENGNTKAGIVRPFDDDRSRVVGSLLKVASGAQAFNGGVQNLQIQDTIGYKAENTIALLADGTEGEPFRNELLDAVANPGDEMRANAARDALVRAGVSDGLQLQRELKALFEIALAADSPEQQKTFYESPPASGNYLPHPSVDPRREDATFVIKKLANRSNEAGKLVRDRLQTLRNRQTSGTGSPEEKKLLDAFGGN